MIRPLREKIRSRPVRVSRRTMARALFIAVMLIAVLAAFNLELALLAALLCAWCFFALVNPLVLLAVSILLLAATPQRFGTFAGPLAKFGLGTVQNLAIVVLATPYLLRHGLRRLWNPVLLACSLMLITSFVGASRLPQLAPIQSLKSYVALLMGPFLFLEMAYPHGHRKVLLGVISLLPLASLLVGSLLLPLKGWSIIALEGGGIWRLQGASTPTHLAVLCLVGVLACLVVSQAQRRQVAVAGVLLFVLVLTGTRVTIVAGGLVALGYVADDLRRSRHDTGFRYTSALILGAGLLFGLAVYGTTLSLRFKPGLLAGVPLGTFGRLNAWRLFWDAARSNLVFGRGLGAATLVYQAQLRHVFHVPHNEFLRLIVDGGFVGLAAGIAGFTLVFRNTLSQAGEQKRFMAYSAAAAMLLMACFHNPLSSQQFAVPFWACMAFIGMKEPEQALTSGAESGTARDSEETKGESALAPSSPQLPE